MCPPPNSFFSVALVAAYSILSRTFWKHWGKLPIFRSSETSGSSPLCRHFSALLLICFYSDSQCSNKTRKITHLIYFNLIIGHRIHWVCVCNDQTCLNLLHSAHKPGILSSALTQELNLGSVFQKLDGLGRGNIPLPPTSQRFFMFQHKKKDLGPAGWVNSERPDKSLDYFWARGGGFGSLFWFEEAGQEIMNRIE